MLDATEDPLDLLRPEVGIEQIEGADRPERPDRSTEPGAGPLLTAEHALRPGRDPGRASSRRWRCQPQ